MRRRTMTSQASIPYDGACVLKSLCCEDGAVKDRYRTFDRCDGDREHNLDALGILKTIGCVPTLSNSAPSSTFRMF